MRQETVLAALYVASCVTGSVTAVLAWRQRRTTAAAGVLALVMTGVVLWSTADLIKVLAHSPQIRAAAALSTYPGVEILVPAFVCLGFSVTNPDWIPSRLMIEFLAVEPVLYLSFVATNHWHHLVHRVGESAGVVELGPVYWVHTVYCYLMLAAGMAVLLRGWLFSAGVHRFHIAEVLAGTTVPIVVNTLPLVGMIGDRSADLTPLAFTFTGGIAAHAILRHGLLRIVPVARELVLDWIGDAIVVIGADGRVADLNPAADRLARRRLPDLPKDLIAMPSERLLGVQLESIPLGGVEHRIQTQEGPLDLDIRVSPLPHRRGAWGGWVLVVRDVTELSRERRMLADANARLGEQVHTIERLRAELAEQAVRDPLTGLHNRRRLVQRLADQFVDGTEPGSPMSVVMVDIDYFKKVNDLHGHGVGDDLLIAVAQTLTRCVPHGSDLVRYGGEEFVVLLLGYSLGKAMDVAEGIRHRCAQVVVRGRDGTPVRCTVSAGVAAYPSTAGTGAELLSAADDALYAAKDSGRNRVVASRARV